MLGRAVKRVAQFCDSSGELHIGLDRPQGALPADVQILLVNDLLKPTRLRTGPRGVIAYALTERAGLYADARPLLSKARQPRTSPSSSVAR